MKFPNYSAHRKQCKAYSAHRTSHTQCPYLSEYLVKSNRFICSKHELTNTFRIVSDINFQLLCVANNYCNYSHFLSLSFVDCFPFPFFLLSLICFLSIVVFVQIKLWNSLFTPDSNTLS